MYSTIVYIARKHALYSYTKFTNPLNTILPDVPALESRGNRPLQMTFEDQLTRKHTE